MTPLECLDLVRARCGTLGLERIETMLRDKAAGIAPRTPPLQYTDLLHVPGLTARPFHDPATFPWAAAFEAAWQEVLAEYHAVVQAGVARDSWEPYGKGWHSRMLYQRGRWYPESTALAPVTTALLRSTHYTQGEFLFSEIAPRGEIPLHSGGCNAVLSMHLALIIPPDCSIRVGPLTRHWTPGKVLAFDDSFIHGVWNDSDEWRVALVWEVWHPELTDAERAAIELVYRHLVNDPEVDGASSYKSGSIS